MGELIIKQQIDIDKKKDEVVNETVNKTVEAKEEIESKESVGMSNPVYTFYNKFVALFINDDEVLVDEISVIEDGSELDGAYTFDIDVYENKAKFEALLKLINCDVQLGNLRVIIQINYETKQEDEITLDTFRDAFKNNPIVNDFVEKKLPLSEVTMPYVIFKKEVVQFYNDDLSDYYGNFNGLYSEIAKDVLNTNGINLCVDNK